MNNWRRTSKQSGHPFAIGSKPGPSRLVGRRSSLLPVVTCGASQRRRPSGRRYLSPISATKRVVNIGHPVKPPVSGTVLACASPTAVFGPCPATRTVCASFGATPSTSTPVNRFWRCTRPQMVPRIGGAACTSCDHSILLPRYGAAPALSEPGVTRDGRCLPVREPQNVTADAPCRAQL